MAGTGVVMDEGQYLQDVFAGDREFGGPGRFAFAPGASRMAERSPGLAADLRQRLMQQWSPYWDMSRPVLIEKSPGNGLNARFLQSLFDDVAFVFITRHPIAVSLATRKWSGTSLFSLVDHWLAAQDIMRRNLPSLRQAIWISYEQLVADPRGTVAGVHRMLGLSPSVAAPLPTQDFNRGYFRDWQTYYLARTAAVERSNAEVTPSAAKRLVWGLRSKGRRYLLSRFGMDLLSTAQEGQAILARYEDRVRGYGYSLTDLSLFPRQAITQTDAAPTPVEVDELV